MKSIHSLLLCFALLFTGLCSLNAQMTDGRARIGFKAGINGSSLYDDANATDKKARLGITGGVFAQIALAKGRMSLRPELLFTTKGSDFNFSNVKQYVESSYIELPLSIEYRLLGFINLHAGAYAGWLASAKGESLTLGFEKEDFEDFDYGWLAGGGIDFGGLGLHFRLSRGLHQIGSGKGLSGLVGDLKNSAWAVTLSYGL